MTFEAILKEEGLEDWKIVFNTGGGLCLYKHKEIWMDKEFNDIALFLHEVAHALTPDEKIPFIFRGDKTGHHVIWGDTYTRLVKKYMRSR